MRRFRFLLFCMAFMTLLFAGCSDSHDYYAPPYDPDEPDDPTITYEVSNFGANDVATILINNMNNDGETPSTSGIAAYNKAAKDGSLAKLALKKRQKGSVKTSARDIIGLEKKSLDRLAKAKKSSINGKIDSKTINTTYRDMVQGDVTPIYITRDGISYEEINVVKLHNNDETSSTLLFAKVNDDGSVSATKAQALEVDKAFGTYNSYDLNGTAIATRVRNTFGHEWNVNGGRDGSTKVVMFLLDGATIGNETYGYFDGSDSLTRSESPYSNEGEILYLNASFLKTEPYDLYATVAHEFQHMCNFNQKFCHDGAFDNGQLELTTINEGQSQLAEDLCGFSLDSPGGANPFLFDGISEYMNESDQCPLYFFDNYTSEYGHGYLLMRYIADRFGLATVTNIATSRDVDTPNIERATKMDFRDFYQDFGLTLLMSDLPGNPAVELNLTSIALGANYIVRGSASELYLPYPVALAGDEYYEQEAYIEVYPFANTYINYAGGSGRSLYLDLWLDDFTWTNMLLESSGVFVSLK